MPAPAATFSSLRNAARPAAFAAAFMVLAGTVPASACACCTDTAFRHVEVQKIDANVTAQLQRLRFAKPARLRLGEAYDEAIIGLDDPVEDFTVAVTLRADRISFALRDAAGRSGTLWLVAPRNIALFEVDPRDEKHETGYGPRLYKEWRITTAIGGDGMFRASATANRRITLVLHGRGSACTEASDFRHWTLLVHGTGTRPFTFYGDLLKLAD